MGLSERVASRYIRAADEIQFEELPEKYQKWAKKMPWEPLRVWHGVHGYTDFRWIESDGRIINVGLEGGY